MFHRTHLSLKVGQCQRFEIEYSPSQSPEAYAAEPPGSLFLRVRNTEPLHMRAAYLAGPYVLYVDCRPLEYSTKTRAFVTVDQPTFEPQLHPGQMFVAEMLCHTYKKTYRWTVDVVSQIIFNPSIAINFELTIGGSKDAVDYVVPLPHLRVTCHDTLDLWNLPVPVPHKPVHLVILTHGLHSNVSADMLFLKEEINLSGEENVVVKGFFGNVCKTERGIKYLGSRVADYVIELLHNELLANVTKISFIGHSLGGLVQTFAIAYLQTNHPWVFQKVQPVNFVTLASPMLGITHENPAYVKLALLAGIVGRTGQDLGLRYTEKGGQPLLLLLPSGPTHQVLKQFLRRTVYANVMNDGIVPLRTSALLYLDYHGISTLIGSQNTVGSADGAGKIPRDLPENEDSQTLALLAMLSYFMPQKQAKQAKPNRFQTVSDTLVKSGNAYEKIPKTSVLESATSLILPPLPPATYISNPDSRENVIIHDKIYTEKDLPEADEEDTPRQKKPALNTRATENGKPGVMHMLASKSEEIKQLVQGNMTEHLEEEIAREYHKAMLWRKVLVSLKPDAHNNIVVRRRFANAFGWPVIDHLVEHHFNVKLEVQKNVVSTDSLDISADGAQLSQILSRDAIHKENEEIDKQPAEETNHTWITTDDCEAIFDGPAGIWSEFSEKMFRLKEEWTTNGAKAQSEPVPQKEEEEPTQGVVGEFL